jgi:hypothetical protein
VKNLLPPRTRRILLHLHLIRQTTLSSQGNNLKPGQKGKKLLFGQQGRIIFSFHFLFRITISISARFWEIAAATIEDLAFGIRSSREPDRVGRRVCRDQALSSGMPLKQGVRKYLLPMARHNPRPPRRANGKWR